MRYALVLGLLLFAAPVPAYADAILVMIAATPTGDGVSTVPVGGDAAFAVAAVNVGSSADIPRVGVRVFTGTGQPLPLTTTICETDPATGRCLNQPNVDQPLVSPFGTGQIRTFSVFVHANAPVAFDPGHTRIAVEFTTLQAHFPTAVIGATYASTSVAVRTAP